MHSSLNARVAQLRLRDLMLLELVEECGSLTEVAVRLHVTQSAITQALQSLEEAFEARLVVRGKRGQRGVRLAPAGVAALMHLRVAGHALARAVPAAASPGTPELRVGALPLAMVRPLPDAIARLRARLPRVRIHLVEDTVANLWQRLETGAVDCIVARMRPPGHRLPDGIGLRTLGHESMVAVLGRRHPAANGRRRPTLRQLRDYDWILPEGSMTRQAVDAMFSKAGLAPPEPVVVSMNIHTSLRLAAASDLVAVVPRAAAVVMQEVLGLTLVAIRWSREQEALTLAWREANLGNPALEAWLRCL